MAEGMRYVAAVVEHANKFMAWKLLCSNKKAFKDAILKSEGWKACEVRFHSLRECEVDSEEGSKLYERVCEKAEKMEESHVKGLVSSPDADAGQGQEA